MKLDNVIRMIDNKEYETIEYDHIGKLAWFDMRFENGNIVRVEKCLAIDERDNDSFLVLYIVPNKRVATEVWKGDYRDNSYYIFNNIYNELERIYE